MKREELRNSTNNWLEVPVVRLYLHEATLEDFVKLAETVEEKYKNKCDVLYSGNGIAGDIGIVFYFDTTDEEKMEIENLAMQIDSLLTDEHWERVN